MTKKVRKILFGTFTWKRPFYSISFVYLTFFFILLFSADKLIFPAPNPHYSGKENWITFIETDSKERVATYYQAAKKDKPTLLWSHGNGEDLGSLKDFLPYITQEGYGVLAYDYPGYGASDGVASENGCYQAINAAYKQLTETLNVDPSSIIIFGQSVGSGPSVWLSQTRAHAGMILVSPFKSAFTTVTRIPIFPRDRFPNIKRISSYEKPLLIIHGTEDFSIPISHGRALFDRAKSSQKTFLAIDNAGHNDIYPKGLGSILNTIATFCKTLN